MTRGRSKSIVQKIASDLASHNGELDVLPERPVDLGESISSINVNNNNINVNNNGNIPQEEQWEQQQQSYIPLSRSQSLWLPVRKKWTAQPASTSTYPLYPFSSTEQSILWSKHIDKYNQDIIISDADIEAIQLQADSSILSFHQKCQLNLGSVTSLISQTDEIIQLLDDLTFKYNYVSRETSDFASKSQALMDKQRHLEDISQEISNNLAVFESLDSITKVLTSPGINIVKKHSFHNVLVKLDVSLDFIKQHAEFKEADTYRVRFRQCMTRSLTLIRNYLIDDLKELQKQVSEKLISAIKKDRDDNSSTSNSFNFDLFLYTEFNNHIKSTESEYYSIPSLSSEIFRRIENHQEYVGLFNDVLNQYFRVRSSLLNDYIWNQIDQSLESFQNDSTSSTPTQTLVQFTQDNISFFKKVINRELSLFQQYFSFQPLGSSQVQLEVGEWFKRILEPLYDTLRNRIIRETNISELCELTTLLQKYYEFEKSDNNNIFTNGGGNIDVNFGELFQPILLDVQQRLIFRIQLYVDEKLMKYKAKPEDLQIGRRKSVGSATLDSEFNENMYEDWFLPVGKALTILSNIYELVNSVVFDDLAHYIVHSCIYMLNNNAYKLALVHLGELDAKLYLLKNLLLLQQQLNNFDIQYVRTETSLDFTSGIQEIFSTIRSGGMDSFKVDSQGNGGVFDLFKKSVPKVVNNMIDAKYEMQTQLTNAVTEFAGGCVQRISEPINKVTAKSHPLADSIKFRDNIGEEIPRIKREMNHYLLDSQVVSYLIDSIKQILLTSYDEFYKQVELQAQQSEAIKQEIKEIMEPDTFFGFLEEMGDDEDEVANSDQSPLKEDVFHE
ncbi:conserved oligomeric Golgi complex subunit 3 [[Candida] anglica]